MIDFPQNPAVGSVFTSGGQQWTWDGVKWLPSGQAAAFVPAMNDNRLINGDMRIDQRNNGASSQASGVYTVDRWQYNGSQASKISWGRNGGGSGFAGLSAFPYSLGAVSQSAYTPTSTDYFQFNTALEGDAISDFAWGTPSAQPVTLSFWAASSLTGTFGGAVQNYAGSRSYPFSFSLPTAATWTKIVITIPGDTGGTWVMSGNAGAMYLIFDFGNGSSRRGPAGAWASAGYCGVTGAVNLVATNAANFYLTGVKLEIGSVATPFNRQSLTKSWADCQRYYQTGLIVIGGYAGPGTGENYIQSFPVQMRATPTVTPAFSTQTNCSGSAINYITAAQFANYTVGTVVGGFALTGSWIASAEL